MTIMAGMDLESEFRGGIKGFSKKIVLQSEMSTRVSTEPIDRFVDS